MAGSGFGIIRARLALAEPRGRGNPVLSCSFLVARIRPKCGHSRLANVRIADNLPRARWRFFVTTCPCLADAAINEIDFPKHPGFMEGRFTRLIGTTRQGSHMGTSGQEHIAVRNGRE